MEPGNRNPDHPAPDSNQIEVLNKLADAQLKQAEVRLLEIEKGSEFSKTALDKQLQDRNHERETSLKRSHARYWLIGFVVVIVAILLAVALYTGNAEIAREILMVVGAYIAGALSGGTYVVVKGLQHMNSSEEE